MSQSPNQNPVSIDLAELHARASALLAVGDLDELKNFQREHGVGPQGLIDSMESGELLELLETLQHHAQFLSEVTGDHVLKMTVEEFTEKFRPVLNDLAEDEPSFDGTMYESYGEEFEHILDVSYTSPDKVWSIVDGPYDSPIFRNGLADEAIGFLVTEVGLDKGMSVVVFNEFHPDNGYTSTYASENSSTNDPSGANLDFSGFEGRKVVLAANSNANGWDKAVDPKYCTVSITQAFVDRVKQAMALCQDASLLDVSFADVPVEWGAPGFMDRADVVPSSVKVNSKGFFSFQSGIEPLELTAPEGSIDLRLADPLSYFRSREKYGKTTMQTASCGLQLMHTLLSEVDNDVVFEYDELQEVYEKDHGAGPEVDSPAP